MPKVVSKTKQKFADIVSSGTRKVKTYSDGSKKIVTKEKMNGLNGRKYKTVHTTNPDGSEKSHTLKQRIFSKGGKMKKKC